MDALLCSCTFIDNSGSNAFGGAVYSQLGSVELVGGSFKSNMGFQGVGAAFLADKHVWFCFGRARCI